VQLPDATVDGAGDVFAVSHKVNAAFQLVNAALAAGRHGVSLAQDPVKTAQGTETGAFLISGLSKRGGGWA
jgi:hypothetical protein